MRQLFKKRWTTVFSVGLAGCVAAALLVLASCTPGNEITVQESDVVATLYDPTADFGAITTFSMPDSIVRLDEVNPDNGVDVQNEEEILALITANLIARGYVLVEASSATPPDVVVLVGATASSEWYYDDWYPYWGWWGGWGYWGYWGAGWGGYYPPGTMDYAYTTGTLLVAMTDPGAANTEDKTIPVYWFGAINGVLDDTKGNLLSRVEDAVDQMFKQSPYLKSDS